MTKKPGRPAFPTKHRTLNVYLPNDLHDRLGAWSCHLGISKSKLIRGYLETCLHDDETDALVKAKQKKVYGR